MDGHQKARFAFVRNEIIEVAGANLHISDLAVQRGYGIFDFLKIKGSHPYFLNDHLDRFFHSAAIMKLNVVESRETISGIIQQLIQKNDIDASGVKIILTGGYSPDGYQITTPNLILTQHPLTLPTPDQVQKGISIITHAYCKEFPEAKTINYTMGIWMLDRIKAAGAMDVLYHHDEVVSEFPRCNLFMVDHHDVVRTPSKNILKGVTRKNILKLSAARFQTVECDITREELLGAKEVFLTSTTKRVLPIVEIDHQTIADGKPGSVSMALLQDLLALEKSDATHN